MIGEVRGTAAAFVVAEVTLEGAPEALWAVLARLARTCLGRGLELALAARPAPAGPHVVAGEAVLFGVALAAVGLASAKLDLVSLGRGVALALAARPVPAGPHVVAVEAVLSGIALAAVVLASAKLDLVR